MRDNSYTNKALCKIQGVTFVGSAFHRFQPPVEDILDEYEAFLGKVRFVTQKLRFPLISVKLRQHTHLKPNVNNDTAWSSSYEVLHRYKEV